MAMDNAEAESILYVTRSRGSSGNLREVDLNETPSMRTRKLQLKLQALVKTGMPNSSSPFYGHDLFC